MSVTDNRMHAHKIKVAALDDLKMDLQESDREDLLASELGQRLRLRALEFEGANKGS